MSSTLFSTAERNRLYELKTTTSLSLRAIGRELGRDVSTILRELRRNRSEEGYYLPYHAQQKITMTIDNGKECSGHGELSERLQLSYYFATPYHSWERGLSEHTNGLLRQFFRHCIMKYEFK